MAIIWLCLPTIEGIDEVTHFRSGLRQEWVDSGTHNPGHSTTKKNYFPQRAMAISCEWVFVDRLLNGNVATDWENNA